MGVRCSRSLKVDTVECDGCWILTLETESEFYSKSSLALDPFDPKVVFEVIYESNESSGEVSSADVTMDDEPRSAPEEDVAKRGRLGTLIVAVAILGVAASAKGDGPLGSTFENSCSYG